MTFDKWLKLATKRMTEIGEQRRTADLEHANKIGRALLNPTTTIQWDIQPEDKEHEPRQT